ncbi:hypothetical protein GCM10008939_28420 [Deinococcus aquiradiocola]|uniref:Uncharacterized protein n=1 Tax=Deinococcus aquiradiocola TaxID=393059 RepID=A0A917UST1_9DEIO|nr:hypothetical protein GCM10008939_28420 [Deinococcus aquiradiocola]
MLGAGLLTRPSVVQRSGRVRPRGTDVWGGRQRREGRSRVEEGRGGARQGGRMQWFVRLTNKTMAAYL